MAALRAIIADPADERLRALTRRCLAKLVATLTMLEGEVACHKRRIHAWHRSSETNRRLETVPSIGPIIAGALVASMSDPAVFKTGRELVAWIGLVPKANSTGRRERLRHISLQAS